jgi:hypothetical protein
VAKALQHRTASQFAGIWRAGAGDVDRRLAECALPFELQFADKAGRRACQCDPPGVAYGHDLGNASSAPDSYEKFRREGAEQACANPRPFDFAPQRPFRLDRV